MNTKRSIVAAGHPLVAKAAIDTIKKGGNAFDAIIAAGFVSTVAEPALTSLGGGGFLLVRTKEGKTRLFDFFVDTPGKGLSTNKNVVPHFFPVTVKFPGSDQIFNIGLGSVAVPGNLKGFLYVHKKLGRLPLEKILEPAIDLCENGVELNKHQAYFLSLLEPIMTLKKEGKAIFLKNGKYCKQGDIIFNKELSSFLKKLPEDHGRSFYEGEIARKIAKDMEKGGGLLTYEDLKTYQVKERQPLKSTFKNWTIITNGFPSFGGQLITLTFNILNNFKDKDFLSGDWGNPNDILTIGRIFKEIEKKKSRLISEEGDEYKNKFTQEAIYKLERLFSKGTTHISICDKEGNVASMTTSNGEGSGYYAPETGIMLNNMMGEDDLHPEGFHSSPPGIRVGSMMSPSLLLKDDVVKLVLGSGGSKRIRTAITQVIINYAAYKMSIRDAVNAPRIHFDGEVFQIEPGYKDAVIESLRCLAPTNLWNHIDVYFGGVHAVEPFKNGAGDPRRGGCVEVFAHNI